MKITKVSEKEIKTGAPVVAGVVGGALVGRGLIAVATKPKDPLVITQAEKNKKMYVQIVMVVAGAYGYMAIAGADTGSLVAKNVALGVALSSAVGLIDDHSKNSDTIKAKLVADTQTNRFLKAAIGLGCACDQPQNTYAPIMQLNRPRKLTHRKGMRNPFENSDYPQMNYENAYEKTLRLAM
jgi:hypothetical protein